MLPIVLWTTTLSPAKKQSGMCVTQPSQEEHCVKLVFHNSEMHYCTPTGSESIPLLLCLDATKFVLLTVFTLTETICPKMWWQLRSKNITSPLPVDVRRSKTPLLKLLNYSKKPPGRRAGGRGGGWLLLFRSNKCGEQGGGGLLKLEKASLSLRWYPHNFRLIRTCVQQKAFFYLISFFRYFGCWLVVMILGLLIFFCEKCEA